MVKHFKWSLLNRLKYKFICFLILYYNQIPRTKKPPSSTHFLSHPSSTQARTRSGSSLNTLLICISLVGGISDSGFLFSLPSHFDHSQQTLVLFPLRPTASSVPCRMTGKETSYLICPVVKSYRFAVS